MTDIEGAADRLRRCAHRLGVPMTYGESFVLARAALDAPNDLVPTPIQQEQPHAR